MRARVESLSPRALAALAAAAVLLFTAVVWFLVVSPKRADASSAATELVAAEKRLANAEAAVLGPRTAGASTTDILKLTKAMPSSEDQAGLVLELTRLARASGVTLEGIAPQEPVAIAGSPTTIPVSVVVNGRYHDVTRFVERVRLLVTVDGGRVAARGRLLAVKSVALVEADTEKYPQLDATVELDAYVYDGPVAPVEIPVPVTEEETSTTSGSTAAGAGP